METNQNQQTQGYNESDEIDLSKIFFTLWRYRLWIVIAFFVSVFLFGVFFIVNYSFPGEKLATVEFRLEFTGAEKGEYPNGLMFDTGDLLSIPVLRQVYEINSLDNYMEFNEFRDSLQILRTESAEFLSKVADYRERLSQSTLSTVDRERIEREFQDVMRDTVSTKYSLNFKASNGVPSSTVYKVLTDILSSWAVDVNERLNVLKYRTPLYSENIIDRDFIEEEDYIIVIDLLRLKCTQIIDNADSIMNLPGAELVKTKQENISIPEIKIRINDLINYKLNPLVGIIRSNAISKNINMTRLYLENRLLSISLDSTALASKSEVFVENIKNYSQDMYRADSGTGTATNRGERQIQDMPTIIPQLGESFIDMIINLAGRNQDVEYRQNLVNQNISYSLDLVDINRDKQFYSDILKVFQRPENRNINSKIDAEIADLFAKRFEKIVQEMVESIKWIKEIYLEISDENLNPQRGLYTITLLPRLTQERMYSLKTTLAIGFVFIGLVMFLTVVGCFIHNLMKGRRQATGDVR